MGIIHLNKRQRINDGLSASSSSNRVRALGFFSSDSVKKKKCDVSGSDRPARSPRAHVLCTRARIPSVQRTADERRRSRRPKRVDRSVPTRTHTRTLCEYRWHFRSAMPGAAVDDRTSRLAWFGEVRERSTARQCLSYCTNRSLASSRCSHKAGELIPGRAAHPTPVLAAIAALCSSSRSPAVRRGRCRCATVLQWWCLDQQRTLTVVFVDSVESGAHARRVRASCSCSWTLEWRTRFGFTVRSAEWARRSRSRSKAWMAAF